LRWQTGDGDTSLKQNDPIIAAASASNFGHDFASRLSYERLAALQPFADEVSFLPSHKVESNGSAGTGSCRPKLWLE
jgi:hypothetical protein